MSIVTLLFILVPSVFGRIWRSTTRRRKGLLGRISPPELGPKTTLIVTDIQNSTVSLTMLMGCINLWHLFQCYCSDSVPSPCAVAFTKLACTQQLSLAADALMHGCCACSNLLIHSVGALGGIVSAGMRGNERGRQAAPVPIESLSLFVPFAPPESGTTCFALSQAPHKCIFLYSIF